MATPKPNRNARKNLKPLNPNAKPFSPPAPSNPPPPPPALGMYYTPGIIQCIPSYKQCLQYNARAQPQLDYKTSSLVYKEGGSGGYAEVTDREKFVHKIVDSKRGNGGKKKLEVSSERLCRRLQRGSLSSDKREKKCSLKWMPKHLDIIGKTTLMIKNIPNKLSREELVSLLDEHCRQENQKRMWGCDPFPSEYDFVYLPMDFKYHFNLGYAFVNFTTEMAAMKFCKYLTGCNWRGFCSNKICQIVSAKIQGKQALVRHFQNSKFNCHTDEYLPVVLDPPSNGSKCITPPKTVGKRALPLYP